MEPRTNSEQWELAAEEHRVVAVHATTAGLRAPIPSILHVCSISRKIGLRTYTLILGYRGCLELTQRAHIPNYKEQVVPIRLDPKVYFNFDRDILYFPKEWNERVDGQYSCFNHLKRLLNTKDMEGVERIGFDLEASICCPRSSTKHGIFLAPWKGIKTLYLGMREDTNKDDSGSDERPRPDISFEDLDASHQEQFMKHYRSLPAWKTAPENLTVEESLNFIKTSTGKLYGEGTNRWARVQLAEGFCENVRPVLVVGNQTGKVEDFEDYVLPAAVFGGGAADHQ